MALITMFLVGFLFSGYQQIIRQREELTGLEREWVYDLQRMEVITCCWQMIEELPKRKCKKFSDYIGSQGDQRKIFAWCPNEVEQYYHLIIEEENSSKERKKHHFLVKKGEKASRLK